MRTLSIRLALATVLLSPIASGQWVQTDGPYTGTFEAITYSGNHLFVGTSYNGIFVSSDSGATWAEASTGLEYFYGQSTHVPSVHCLAGLGSNLFAGTTFAGVYRSTDQGASWTPVNSELGDKNILALCASGTTLYAGTQSGVFSTDDNGSSWTADTSGLPADRIVFSLIARGTTIFAGTWKGVFVSTDHGSSWKEVNTGLEYTVGQSRSVPSVFSLAAEGTNIYAGTYLNGLYVSSDNGGSWKQSTSSFSSQTVQSLLVRGDSIFAGTWGVGVHLSTNGGSTWTAVNSGMGNQKVAALAHFGARIFAGTEIGLFSSSDETCLWSVLPLSLRSTSVEAFASDGSRFYTVAARNNVFSSLDDGETWTWMGRPTADFHAYCLACAGHTLLIGGTCTIGRVERSTDNGVTWVRSLDTIGAPYGSDFNAEAFAIRQSQLLVGGNGVWRSSDEGVSWSRIDSGSGPTYVMGLAFIDSFAFAGGYYGVYRLRGNDTLLTNVSTGLPLGFSVKSLAARDTMLFAGGWSGGVYRSTDYGMSWVPENNGLKDSIIMCLAVSGSTILAGTSSQGVFASFDDGLSWNAINGGLPSRKINALGIHGNYLFAGTGDNYGVWRRPLSELTGPDKEVGGPATYILEQNFPNPFNSTTVIRYELPHRSDVFLAIYNNLGQKVAELVNSQFEAGFYEVKFDGSKLASGVYYYRIQTGDFVQTRKLLLLK